MSGVKDISERAIRSPQERLRLYKKSIEKPEHFWADIASKNFYWQRPFSQELVCEYNFDIQKGDVFQRWFADGITNVCFNAVDRHIEQGQGSKVAFYWEGNTENEKATYTYLEVQTEVCKLAAVLRREFKIAKGDVVTLYLPLIPFGPIAMLACARIGAVCNVVFSGFSANALAKRILDGSCNLVITADKVYRGEKCIQLKNTVDQAIEICKNAGNNVKVLLFERHGRDVAFDLAKDTWYSCFSDTQYNPHDSRIEWVEAEHPLFVLYTSGSTGSPKGILHSTGGYMVYAAYTFSLIFNYEHSDIYFCTADLGWITGHTYGVFGPMLNNATCVLFEGIPLYPTPARWWEIIDRYMVTIFYTAPTAVRALMKEGEKWLQSTSRESLRILGSVGEPINVPAWKWYNEVVGRNCCEIMDTWWQTETGGILITPIPGCTDLEAGSVTLPFFGIQPVVLDMKGGEISGECEGPLALRFPWPGQARSILGDHQRFIDTYFKPYPGYYFSGDGCRRDNKGYYWITGRVDDVLNVSGHRLGAGEVENAINQTSGIMESAVISIPHEIKGESIFAFVIMKKEYPIEPHALEQGVSAKVRQIIGPIATPEGIQITPELPKTRSGKIMRRILRQVAIGKDNDLGDISTLADPSIVSLLVELCHENKVLSKTLGKE